MRELGYVEGKTFTIDTAGAEGKYERLPMLAVDLVQLKVDVLVTFGTPGTRAAKQATTTIPIVMAGSAPMAMAGLVASLGRPSGNVTGSTFFSPEINVKRLQLLREALPRISRVAVLANPENSFLGPITQEMEAAAGSIKIRLQQFDARAGAGIASAFASMKDRRIEAVAVVDDAMLIANAKTTADLAMKHGLASVGFHELAEAGGLIGYSGESPDALSARGLPSWTGFSRAPGRATCPVERSTRFDLIVNGRTARALGTHDPAVGAGARGQGDRVNSYC